VDKVAANLQALASRLAHNIALTESSKRAVPGTELERRELLREFWGATGDPKLKNRILMVALRKARGRSPSPPTCGACEHRGQGVKCEKGLEVDKVLQCTLFKKKE
jgi:hypothetical protein